MWNCIAALIQNDYEIICWAARSHFLKWGWVETVPHGMATVCQKQTLCLSEKIKMASFEY